MSGAPMPSEAPVSAPSSRRAGTGLVAAAIATVIALAILVGLGTWQMQRLAWKEDLIARIEARAFGPPGEILPEADWASFSEAEQEYRRVAVSGEFLHDREVQVHGLLPGRTKGQPVQGFHVLTPLRLETGAHVVVNRGFVPTPLRDPAARPGNPPEGRVTVTGLVRASQERAAFVPENDPAAETWLTRDVFEIAAARGLERVAPFYIDAEHDPAAPEWPRGGGTILDLPNNHLQYAITWYGLAGVLVIVFGVFAVRRLRGAPAA